jgi:esterase
MAALRLARTVVSPHAASASASPARPPLLVLHGVLGSAATYASLLRRPDCAPSSRKVAPDLPGHGRTPHDPSRLTYHAMADDVAALIADEAAGAPVDVAAHSMGGKVAMALALRQPELVRRLVVVDIAPVSYVEDLKRRDGPTRVPYVAARAMQALARAGLGEGAFPSREHVDNALEMRGVEDHRVRAFVGTNLVSLPGEPKGAWEWRCDVDGIVAALDRTDGGGILQFDAVGDGNHQTQEAMVFDKPTLFVAGGESAYVDEERNRDAIYGHFPNASVKTIEGSGHWVQADKPAAFCALLNHFLYSDDI